MADEKDTDDTNKVTLDISEYNALKAGSSRATALETDLAKEREKYSTLTADYDTLKKTKKIEGPSKEDLEKDIRTSVQAQIDELTGKVGSYESRIKKHLVTDKIMGLLNDKITPDARRYLAQDIERECHIDGDFDNYSIVIKDEKGNDRWSAKRQDQKMNEEEYIELLQSRTPSFFKSGAKSGEGDNGKKQSAGGNNTSLLTEEEVNNMPKADLRKIVKEQPERVRHLIG